MYKEFPGSKVSYEYNGDLIVSEVNTNLKSEIQITEILYDNFNKPFQSHYLYGRISGRDTVVEVKRVSNFIYKNNELRKVEVFDVGLKNGKLNSFYTYTYRKGVLKKVSLYDASTNKVLYTAVVNQK